MQGAREAAARGVLHGVQRVSAGIQRGVHEARQRRHVRAQVALELEPAALRQDREAVVAERAGDQDAVPRPQAGVRHHPLGEGHAGRVQDDPVELPAPHHLGVAGHHRGAALAARLPQRAPDALQVGAREALLDHDAAGEEDPLCRPHHREVVHGARRGQAADVAAGEEQRVHYVGVGGKGQAIALLLQGRQIKAGLIFHAGQLGVGVVTVEGTDEHGADQFIHGFAAAAMGQGNDAAHADCLFCLSSCTSQYW